MKALFVIDHNTNKNISQVVMFVRDDFDRRKVVEAAQEAGIEHPNILAVLEIEPREADRIVEFIDYYAVYSR